MGKMIISECCGAPAWAQTDICTECKDHANFVDTEEYEEE